MFTLGNFYIVIYLLVFILFSSHIFFNSPYILISKFSTTIYITFIQKYTNLKLVFFFFILILSGLPPFGFFFLKFNILTLLMYQVHIVLIFFFFLFFLANMFFYVQLFNFKNYKLSSYIYINNEFISNWQSTRQVITYNFYNYIFMLFIFFFFIFFFIFFYNDFFLILSILN